MRVLLTGGGTGGHIYPALAVARRLQEMDSEIELLYVGTKRGLESTIVPREDLPFKSIEIEGFKRKLDFEGIKYNLRSVGLFLKSIQEAKKISEEQLNYQSLLTAYFEKQDFLNSINNN